MDVGVGDDRTTESLLFTDAGRPRDLGVVLVPRRLEVLRVRSTANPGGFREEGQPGKGC